MKKYATLFMTTVAIVLGATDWFVDYSKADNHKGSGTEKNPFRDFKTALKAAKEGDTIKIVKVDFPIRDSIRIKNRKNLTVDGMLNTFSGLEKAKKENWRMISPGLWKRDIRMQMGVSRRYFMVINGKLNRMGRFFKAPCRSKYKKISELKENEWTIIQSKNSQQKRTFLFSVYLKLDKNINCITGAGVEEPRYVQQNGVDISGRCSNIHIKNVICRNFWNDGFNIHNSVHNTTFNTICAIDCGDDGISAHEDSKIKIENFVSLGNSTGICHIQQVTASHLNCYIEGALGRDIYFKSAKDNKLDNSFKNVYIKTTSAGGVYLGAAPQDKIHIDNMTVFLASPAASFIHTPDTGANCRLNKVNILRQEPEQMVRFRKELFRKFGNALLRQ